MNPRVSPPWMLFPLRLGPASQKVSSSSSWAAALSNRQRSSITASASGRSGSGDDAEKRIRRSLAAVSRKLWFFACWANEQQGQTLEDVADASMKAWRQHAEAMQPGGRSGGGGSVKGAEGGGGGGELLGTVSGAALNLNLNLNPGGLAGAAAAAAGGAGSWASAVRIEELS